MNNFVSRLAPAVVLCLPLLAFAQGGSPEPAPGKGASPALRHDSAFADYKPWQDIRPGNWRELNDRLAPAPAPAPAVASEKVAPPAAPAAPAAPAQERHHMHGGRR